MRSTSEVFGLGHGNEAQPHRSTKEGFVAFLDEVATFARSKGKGLAANETVRGARDHALRVEVPRFTLDEVVLRTSASPCTRSTTA